jgi:hypothetical protein
MAGGRCDRRAAKSSGRARCGMVNAKVAPGPSFGDAQRRPSVVRARANRGHCFILVKLAINERTHVVPPSFEYDSSYWWDSGWMLDHIALTRITLSFTVS